MELKTFLYPQESMQSLEEHSLLDSNRTLVMIFGAPEYIDTPGAILDIVKTYPNSHVIGCSTSGEIFGTRLYDGSLSVGVARFRHTSLATATAPVRSAEDSYLAGVRLAEQLFRPSLQGVLVLSDGLRVNGSSLVRGLNSIFPRAVVVTGGLAGDGERFKRTWTMQDGMPRSAFVSAVGFYGDRIAIGHGSKGGWDIFGPERRVTRSAGNILYELDGQPALQLYKTYLGERAEGLPATALLFPLALRTNASDQKRIVRTILAVDESAQSMIFAGDIPQGNLAQLMRANFDRLIQGASEAATMLRGSQNHAQSVLSIAISCVGRRLVLGQRTEEELEATLDVLPKQTQQIGFYSYGEISPYATGHCDLHNQTMTLTTIEEL